MGEVVYTSRVRIEKKSGPNRDAWVPAHEGPVRFGVHGAIAAHYGRGSGEEHTTTLDYVVAAAAGWLTGTLGGALEAREIASAPDRLSAEAEGEMEAEDGVLVLKRIRVRYVLRLPAGREDAARRVHEVHHRGCPVYRSIAGCVEITTELQLEPLE